MVHPCLVFFAFGRIWVWIQLYLNGRQFAVLVWKHTMKGIVGFHPKLAIAGRVSFNSWGSFSRWVNLAMPTGFAGSRGAHGPALS